MAEIVGSAVVNEAVSRLSSLVSGDRSSHAHESVEAKVERLEMAVLKIRSVVAISEQWHITHPPLLHWKAKLKRVAKEGDDILHAQKRQILQSREGSSSAATTTFAKRIIQAGKRFVPFSRKDDDQIHSAVQRFERLAHGTDSFFKFVEHGGHPKKPFVLPPLTPRPLLAGKSMEFSLRRGSRDAVILLCPRLNPQVNNRLEAFFMVSYEDDVMWEKNMGMLFWFHVSEATDIMGSAMRCLDLLPPQFSAACAAIEGLVAETIDQGTEYSNLSTKSMWWYDRFQGYFQSSQFYDFAISGIEAQMSGHGCLSLLFISLLIATSLRSSTNPPCLHMMVILLSCYAIYLAAMRLRFILINMSRSNHMYLGSFCSMMQMGSSTRVHKHRRTEGGCGARKLRHTCQSLRCSRSH